MTRPPQSGTWVRNTAIPIQMPVDSFSNYRATAVGDFNRDGVSDIVFEYTPAGTHAIWLMKNGLRGDRWARDGAFWIQSPASSPVTQFTIVTAADFNRDGVTDLVAEHSETKDRQIWIMQDRPWTTEIWKSIAVHQIARPSD